MESVSVYPDPMPRIDVVTVYHEPRNWQQHLELKQQIEHHEDDQVNFIAVSNMEENRGFSRACNLGAKEAITPILGFLNPDCQVRGSFVDQVIKALSDERVAIAGCRYGKPERELRAWGCREWVCGAAMFVRRSWFEESGGFDERYVWGWEDTDLVRRAESQELEVRPLPLPIHHSSPNDDREFDVVYKRFHFNAGAKLFLSQWRR